MRGKQGLKETVLGERFLVDGVRQRQESVETVQYGEESAKQAILERIGSLAEGQAKYEMEKFNLAFLRENQKDLVNVREKLTQKLLAVTKLRETIVKKHTETREQLLAKKTRKNELENELEAVKSSIDNKSFTREQNFQNMTELKQKNAVLEAKIASLAMSVQRADGVLEERRTRVIDGKETDAWMEEQINWERERGVQLEKRLRSAKQAYQTENLTLTEHLQKATKSEAETLQISAEIDQKTLDLNEATADLKESLAKQAKLLQLSEQFAEVRIECAAKLANMEASE